jgi:multidrug efflux pump subunit AcrA (membrane-fusion protein)
LEELNMSVERAEPAAIPDSGAGPGPAIAEASDHPESPEPDESRYGPWLRRLRKPYVWISIVVVIALAVWWFGIRSTGSSNSSSAVGVTLTKQLVTVTRGDMSDTVSADGTIAAAQTDNLSFSSAGTVTAVNVAAGDTVQAGQVLATIDSAQLQSAVSSAQSTLATAQAKLSDDEASGASAAQITADETSVTSANDALTSAQQALAGASLVATFNGTVSEVNITTGEQLGSSGTGGTGTTGSNSGSGRSSSSLGSSNSGGFAGGNTSSSSSAQIQVVSKGSYTVSLPISSSDIANVQPGQTVTMTLTTATGSGFGGFGGAFRALFGGGGGAGAGAGGTGSTGRTGTGGSNATGNGSSNAAGGGGATATGTVATVAKVASASSGVATYPVTVNFTADASQFYVGATVSGAIATNVRQNVLQVPTRAVTTDSNGDSVVTVATKGKLSGPTVTRVVKTGETANGNVEITSGLQEGDSVVVTVPTFTRSGSGSTSTGTGNFGGFGGGGGGFGGFGGSRGGGAGTGGTGAGG